RRLEPARRGGVRLRRRARQRDLLRGERGARLPRGGGDRRGAAAAAAPLSDRRAAHRSRLTIQTCPPRRTYTASGRISWISSSPADSPWCSVMGLPPSTARVTTRSGADDEYRMPCTWMRGSPGERAVASGRPGLGDGAARRVGAAGGGLVATPPAGASAGGGEGAAIGGGATTVATGAVTARAGTGPATGGVGTGGTTFATGGIGCGGTARATGGRVSAGGATSTAGAGAVGPRCRKKNAAPAITASVAPPATAAPAHHHRRSSAVHAATSA